MAFTCEACGYRNSEIKTGGPISAQGTRLCLLVRNAGDLSRDLLKSSTASLFIPELDLSLGAGTLGGRFTTIEGVLATIRDELKNNTFLAGDSAEPERKEKWDAFLRNLDDLIALKQEFHLIIEDPLSNSYIQSLSSPGLDPQLECELYDRTPEQNAELGIDGSLE